MILAASEILMFPTWILEMFNSPCITLEEFTIRN